MSNLNLPEVEAFVADESETPPLALPPVEEYTILDTMKKDAKEIGKAGLAVAAGIAHGGVKFGAGIDQLLTGNEERARRSVELSEQQTKRMPGVAEHPTLTALGTFGGESAPAFAIPGALGTKLGSQLASGAAIGAGLGASSYVPEGGNRLLNTAIGAFAGTAGPLISKGLGKAFGGSIMGRADELAAAKQRMALLEKYGPTVGQVSGKESLQVLEGGMLGRIPIIGMKGKLRAQVDTIRSALSKFADESLPKGIPDELLPRHLNQTLQKSITEAHDKATVIVDDAYKQFSETAAKLQNKIPLHTVKQAISEATENTKMLNSLGYKADKADEILKLETAFSQIDELPPKALNSIRKDLGKVYEKLIRSDPGSARQVLQIKNALDQDLARYAEKSGDNLNTLYKNARQKYQELLAPFKDEQVLASSLTGRVDSDQLLNMIVKKERPELASRILQNLTPEGKAAVRGATFKKIISNSLDKEGQIDVLKVNKELKGLKTTLMEVLPKAQFTEMKGLIKVIEHMADGLAAGQSKGMFVQGMLGGGGATIGMTMAPGTTMSIMATVGAVSKALESPATSKWLIKAAEGKVGSDNMNKIVRSLLLPSTKNSDEEK